MAMVFQIRQRAAHCANAVDVGRIGGQQQNRGGLGRQAIEPRPAERQARQRVSEIIQSCVRG